MTLTGQLTGSDRAHIERQAEQIAAEQGASTANNLLGFN